MGPHAAAPLPRCLAFAVSGSHDVRQARVVAILRRGCDKAGLGELKPTITIEALRAAAHAVEKDKSRTEDTPSVSMPDA